MADGARRELQDVLDSLGRRIQERPYPMLALGLFAGYVAGGGFFSSLTRPVARAALGALLVPGVRDRLREVAAELGAARAAQA